ncbi:hypothetical protein SPRG_19772 [Saprolegnia parasitica CBS 223.65]|uniref:PHD-type domain-containing protein n=1 Tax=Saprolegnia parasitica (strain CBS 223.65) TaxID=695850 RepID=A0A067CIA3_SAPPC|nr:hypothetical protein SPRG_19772 [Saprolegnia parasitica CBS 223.65]KDO30213.1 hypothetical protein SPRG_19772 [Saprolegnia parasitica CBS 223.65]|eukprot:XP_012199027.1 hypothetical protein SPRG_19772 [Saprolegnia parasitica CBS 223.65]
MEHAAPEPYRANRAWLNAVTKTATGSEVPPEAPGRDVVPPLATRPAPAAPVRITAGDTQRRPAESAVDVNSYEWKLRAYKIAVKRNIPLVSRCSFVQQGACHLCNGTAITMVVNLCPQFDYSHSICLRHLDSVLNATMNDLLCGKVFPCPICAHECPCGLCERLIAKDFECYEGWEQSSEAKRDARTPPPALMAIPSAAALPASAAPLATVRTLNAQHIIRPPDAYPRPAAAPKMAAKSTGRMALPPQPPMVDVADAKEPASYMAPPKVAAKSLPRVSSKQQVLEAKTPSYLESDAMLRADSKDTGHAPRQLKTAAKSLMAAAQHKAPAFAAPLAPTPTPTPAPIPPIRHAPSEDDDATEASGDESASTSSGSDDDEPRLKPVRFHARTEFGAESKGTFGPVAAAADVKSTSTVSEHGSATPRSPAMSPDDKPEAKEVAASPSVEPSAVVAEMRAMDDDDDDDNDVPLPSPNVSSAADDASIDENVSAMVTDEATDLLNMPLDNELDKSDSAASPLPQDQHAETTSENTVPSAADAAAMETEDSAEDDADKVAVDAMGAAATPSAMSVEATPPVVVAPAIHEDPSAAPEQALQASSPEKPKQTTAVAATPAPASPAISSPTPMSAATVGFPTLLPKQASPAAKAVSATVTPPTQVTPAAPTLTTEPPSLAAAVTPLTQVTQTDTVASPALVPTHPSLVATTEVLTPTPRQEGMPAPTRSVAPIFSTSVSSSDAKAKMLFSTSTVELAALKPQAKPTKSPAPVQPTVVAASTDHEPSIKTRAQRQVAPPPVKQTRSAAAARDAPAAKRAKTEETAKRPSIDSNSAPAKRARGAEPKAPLTLESDSDDESMDDDDDDDELDANLDYCSICKEDGDLVCCDKCPRSFHLLCLKMGDDDLPEGDWECPECTGHQDDKHFDAVFKGRDARKKSKAMELVLKALTTHQFAKPFMTPVQGIKGYDKIVKKRMDLATVQRRLADGDYDKSVGFDKAFLDDIALIWDNCLAFNELGSGLYRAAVDLRDRVAALIAKFRAVHSS